MSGRHGAYARRNAAHRARQAELLTQAARLGSWAELQVTFDVFRSAVRLLGKRRPPLGTPPGTHEAQAEVIIRQLTRYLRDLAVRIDAGDYDARKAA